MVVKKSIGSPAFGFAHLHSKLQLQKRFLTLTQTQQNTQVLCEKEKVMCVLVTALNIVHSPRRSGIVWFWRFTTEKLILQIWEQAYKELFSERKGSMLVQTPLSTLTHLTNSDALCHIYSYSFKFDSFYWTSEATAAGLQKPQMQHKNVLYIL